MIDHAVTFYRYEEGCGWVLDEVLIEAEVGGSVDDSEHGVNVSHRLAITAHQFIDIEIDATTTGVAENAEAMSTRCEAEPGVSV